MLFVEAIALELTRRGVRYVFGIPGKESLRLCTELLARGATFVAARHETQAVMMADGYWRASGQLGVALVAQGAGLVNAAGGMACASRAKSGVVVISGDLLRSDAADDPQGRAFRALKGVEPEALSASVGMRCVRPARPDVQIIAEALDAAIAGCAVSLIIPSDLFSAQATGGVAPSAVPPAPTAPDATGVDAIVELLTAGWAAERPVIVAGRGAVRAGAVDALRGIAERCGALLSTTLLARSAFRGEKFDIGVCGTFATPVASELISGSDCVVAFGASLNPFTTYGGTLFPKRARIVQVDTDPAALGKFGRVDLGVVGDARSVADAVLAQLVERGYRADGHRTSDVARRIAGHDARRMFKDESGGGYIDPRTLMAELNVILPRERTLVVDAGLHLHNACTFLDVERPADFVFPIDSLAVGLGVGAAVGAALARPDRMTVLEVGDCGLMMSLGDLDTAIRLRLPLVVVVSNDQAWGAEAQHLEALGLSTDFVRMETPSLAALATSMGAEGHTISSPADLQAIAPRISRPPERPVLLDCRVHPGVRPTVFNFDYAGVFAK